MKRQMLLILFFLIAGIIMGRYCNALFLIAAIPPAAIISLKNKTGALLLLPIMSVIGFLMVQNSLSVKDMNVDFMAANNETVTVNCRVTDISTTGAGNQKITVAAASVAGSREYSGQMVLQAVLPEGETVKLGQYLVLTGRLSELDSRRNPGGYDEFMYLRSRKIEYKLYPDVIVKKGVMLSPLMLVKLFRARVADVIDRAYAKEEAGIMKAIIIGDKSGMDEDVMRLYRDAGIYHILAVSGLHVGIIFSVLNWLLLFIGLDYRKAGYIAIGALLIYCVFTGAGPSTARAVIMTSTVIFGNIIFRKSDPLTTISLACVVLLLYEPLYLWDVGFLYSFAAVYGLNVGTKPLEKIIRNRFLQKYLCACIAAFLATMPITAYFFFNVSWLSVLANALLVPTVFLVVISGLLSVVFGFLHIAAGTFFAGGAYALLKLYEFVCTISTSVPFSVMLTGHTPIWLLLSFYLTLGLGYYALYGDFNKLRVKGFWLSAAVFAVLLVFSRLPQRDVDFTMLDVGQGDSTVIVSKNKAVIIDGGGNFLKEIGDNTGKWVVGPYLNYKGIEKAEAAFLSHIDSDHAMGIIELLDAHRIKKLFMPDVVYNSSEMYDRVIESAQKSRTEIVYISAGDSITLGELTFKCVYPQKGLRGRDNNQSLVLMASCGDTTLLFTGDMEAFAEGDLLGMGVDITADILKVAHHGSKTSSTKNFLEAVSPDAAIIGVSRFNSYGHPHASVMERLYELDIPVYTTARDGAITILTDGRYIKLRTMLGGKNEKY